MGDFASRFRRSWWLTLINYDSYFPWIEYQNVSIVIYNLDSGITANYSNRQASFYSMQVSFCFHSLRSSEILVSASICTKIWARRFHRTEEVSNNFPVSWHMLFLSFFLFEDPTSSNGKHAISHLGPKNLSRTGGPEHYLVYGRPKQIPNKWVKADPQQVGKTDHNVGGLACILRLT